MANCKHLKIKLNRKLECKVTGKIITWSDCKNCVFRKYDLVGIDLTKYKKKTKPKKDVSSKTRAIVKKRDKGLCQLCGNKAVQLHHIVYRSEDRSLIDEPNNLISLCLKCHNLVHSNKKLYQPLLKERIKSVK